MRRFHLFSTINSSKFLNTKKSLSTKEMYREAAKLLGIDCSLSSSCRCYDCQSHYFDYDDSTEPMDETDSGDEDSGSEGKWKINWMLHFLNCLFNYYITDTDSYSSDLNEPDHYVTNCYLIHTEELCECCQTQSEQRPPSSSLTDIACNDLSFNTFLP